MTSTLLNTGAWQQVTRIDVICVTRMSPTSGFTTKTCVRPVSPRQHHQRGKRLCNRSYTGFGRCCLFGSFLGAPVKAVCVDPFLDPQLDHGETCRTAEATRGHSACVHTVLGPQTCDRCSPPPPPTGRSQLTMDCHM